MINSVEIKEGPFKIDELTKGQMQKWGEARWYLCCPRCGNTMALDHDVKLNDKEITVTPSIGCSQCRLHIFVKNSQIEYLSDM